MAGWEKWENVAEWALLNLRIRIPIEGNKEKEGLECLTAGRRVRASLTAELFGLDRFVSDAQVYTYPTVPTWSKKGGPEEPRKPEPVLYKPTNLPKYTVGRLPRPGDKF